jgi:hypothetical protein
MSIVCSTGYFFNRIATMKDIGEGLFLDVWNDPSVTNVAWNVFNLVTMQMYLFIDVTKCIQSNMGAKPTVFAVMGLYALVGLGIAYLSYRVCGWIYKTFASSVLFVIKVAIVNAICAVVFFQFREMYETPDHPPSPDWKQFAEMMFNKTGEKNVDPTGW